MEEESLPPSPAWRNNTLEKCKKGWLEKEPPRKVRTTRQHQQLAPTRVESLGKEQNTLSCLPACPPCVLFPSGLREKGPFRACCILFHPIPHAVQFAGAHSPTKLSRGGLGSAPTPCRQGASLQRGSAPDSTNNGNLKFQGITGMDRLLPITKIPPAITVGSPPRPARKELTAARRSFSRLALDCRDAPAPDIWYAMRKDPDPGRPVEVEVAQHSTAQHSVASCQQHQHPTRPKIPGPDPQPPTLTTPTPHHTTDRHLVSRHPHPLAGRV